MGEIPEGLPGSTVERGRRGKTRQELGRPSRLLPRREDARKASQGIRLVSHGRGNPDTDGGRSLTEAEDESDRAQPGGPPEQNEGRPRVERESEQRIVRGGRASRRRGEGADRHT